MGMKTKSIFALLLILSFISACAQATPTIALPPTGSVSGTSTVAYPPPGSITAVPTTGAYPGPTYQPYPGPTIQPTQAELTPAQQAAIQEVSTKYNIPADQITIISTEPMTWNNGCMGVVLPGVMCTDVIVNGFIIKLQANGQQFEIHTNQQGTSVVDAAQLEATLNFVVRTNSQSIQVVNSNIPLGSTYNPAFTGFLPQGGSISGTAYVLSSSFSTALAVNATSQQELPFIQNPTYGLAIWPGGPGAQPMLAWGTQPSGNDRATSLMMASPDGSNVQTLLTITPNTQSTVQLLAEVWSADGKSLYFSKEPVGIGGYIVFSGASNLYKIDIATKQVTEVIPQSSSGSLQICLDALSLDYHFVADHCAQGAITIRDSQTGSTASVQVPSDFTGYRFIGSARFSPAGNQVAFALAKGDPNDEQGWLAIGNSTGGTAKIIVTGDTGSYYNVIGWVDDQTLLVQQISVSGANATNQVLTVKSDGSVISKVAEGILLSVIDNR
jgi:hypothetical protein